MDRLKNNLISDRLRDRLKNIKRPQVDLVNPLLCKKDQHLQEVHFSTEELLLPAILKADSLDREQAKALDPAAGQKILLGIESDFFQENFDSSKHELQVRSRTVQCPLYSPQGPQSP